MRLLSWNIQYGKGGADGRIDLKRIARVIRSRELPDVMGLQEISRWDPNTDSGVDQLEQLRELFPEYQAFYGAALERSGGVDGKLRPGAPHPQWPCDRFHGSDGPSKQDP